MFTSSSDKGSLKNLGWTNGKLKRGDVENFHKQNITKTNVLSFCFRGNEMTHTSFSCSLVIILGERPHSLGQSDENEAGEALPLNGDKEKYGRRRAASVTNSEISFVKAERPLGIRHTVPGKIKDAETGYLHV